jgi:hypothetical protein
MKVKKLNLELKCGKQSDSNKLIGLLQFHKQVKIERLSR